MVVANRREDTTMTTAAEIRWARQATTYDVTGIPVTVYERDRVHSIHSRRLISISCLLPFGP